MTQEGGGDDIVMQEVETVSQQYLPHVHRLQQQHLLHHGVAQAGGQAAVGRGRPATCAHRCSRPLHASRSTSCTVPLQFFLDIYHNGPV